MDGRRFDHLAQTLVAPGSRRGVLRVLSGVGLFGTLAHFGLQRVAAQCGLVRTSTQGASRCSRRSSSCCEHAICKKRRCKCEQGWCDANDDGVCEVQLGTDAACNACDDACGEFEACRGLFDSQGKVCCRPLGQVCELGQCCFETGPTNSCQVIANKGPRGCGYREPNTDNRCCIPNGASGASSDCDCCGTSVYCEGICIPESCSGLCTKSCTSNADCGSGCFLTCQEEGGAGGPKHCLPPF